MNETVHLCVGCVCLYSKAGTQACDCLFTYVSVKLCVFVFVFVCVYLCATLAFPHVSTYSQCAGLSLSNPPQLFQKRSVFPFRAFPHCWGSARHSCILLPRKQPPVPAPSPRPAARTEPRAPADRALASRPIGQSIPGLTA